MLTTKVPLQDASGKVTGLVGISRDITERKQADQQALELRNERERVQILHQFIGDATHDLMTPIAGINLSTELARKASTPERLIGHLDQIESMSESAAGSTAGDAHHVTVGHDDREDLELRTVDLAQLLGGLVETFRPRAEAKAQQLSGEVNSRVGTLQADELYLGMALAKIVDNAIHYTDERGQDPHDHRAA